ncbi:MAG: NlpC/P60 family protein [Lachnospiraceae bacterium]|nr:NlpC/P60 family protein [Lachnospiraceae bacterium]
MMRKIKKLFVATVITSSLIVVPVLATPNVNQIEQNKAETEKKLEDANSKLVTLLTDFEVLKGDIRNQEAKIALADKDLQKAKKKEEKQYKEMLVRIKYMYENSDGSELSALLGAESFGEMINQVEYMKNIHEYDRKMLDEYKKSKEKVATLKQDLESGKADMEFMATTYEQQEKELKTTINTMKTQVADFDVQLANAQKQAEEEAKRLEEQTQQMEANLSDAKPQNKPSKPQTNRPSSNDDSKGEEEKPSEPKPEKPSKPDKPKPDKPSKPSKPDNNKPSNVSKGQQIADEGLKYVGNPYVWGGNDLYNGIDCSGFTSKVHAICGVSGVPRNSAAQRTGGKAVNGLSNALPGDIICYEGHVAIYIGNGRIVHASNPSPYPQGGIKTGTATYRTILAIRRYW